MAGINQYATGKRKSAIARAWVTSGSGEIQINGRTLEHHFPLLPLQAQVHTPFEASNSVGQFNVKATVCGGGVSGQAGAVRHAISKALVAINSEYRGALKKLGLLTRDSRVKERKKYGLKGARARFQYSKR